MEKFEIKFEKWFEDFVKTGKLPDNFGVNIKKQYETAVNAYIKRFENKHEIDFEGWVGDDVGTVAMFGDYYFNFEDIRRDIDMDLHPDMLFNWYNFALEYYETTKNHVNFQSYIRGFRG